MVLSSSERDDLVRRVEQKLGRWGVRRDVIRDVVDRTLGALPAAEPATVASGDGSRDGSREGVRDGSREGVREEQREGRGGAARGVAIVAAASTPDLASRLRRELEGSGVTIHRMAVATEGRFTVATIAVPEASEGAVRSAAEALGARISWRGGGR
ncbi:MAG: hypothetical protein AMXMBFR55_17090 [Gemmatimonadota bacterium]